MPNPDVPTVILSETLPGLHKQATYKKMFFKLNEMI